MKLWWHSAIASTSSTHKVRPDAFSLQSVRRAQGTLNANKGKLEGDFAPEHKQEGQQAMAALDAALKDFAATVDANDKQARMAPASGASIQLDSAAFSTCE